MVPRMVSSSETTPIDKYMAIQIPNSDAGSVMLQTPSSSYVDNLVLCEPSQNKQSLQMTCTSINFIIN